MKTYIRPLMICLEIRAEESMAAARCDDSGACTGPVEGDLDENKIPDFWSLS